MTRQGQTQTTHIHHPPTCTCGPDGLRLCAVVCLRLDLDPGVARRCETDTRRLALSNARVRAKAQTLRDLSRKFSGGSISEGEITAQSVWDLGLGREITARSASYLRSTIRGYMTACTDSSPRLPRPEALRDFGHSQVQGKVITARPVSCLHAA
jgi:hypothetical protein